MKRFIVYTLVTFVVIALFDVKALAAPTIVWEKTYPGISQGGSWVADKAFTYSSPIPVQSNGGTMDIVIGSSRSYGSSLTPDRALIFDGSDGTLLHMFSAPANSISVADIDQDGADDIFIGAGGSEVECQGDGALYSFAAWGGQRFLPKTYPDNSPFIGKQCSKPSVFASPAIADIDKDGSPDLSFGVLGLRAWTADVNGNGKYGWPFYWDDTIYGSPALADITGDGQTEVIMPGDSSAGGEVDHRGGMVRAFTGKGQQLWEYRINEIVRSSPSIGDIDGDGDIEIVFGAGNYWARQPGGATDCSRVFALRRDGTLKWSKDTGAQVMTSPTLADFNGDGRLDVAVGGWRSPCQLPADVNDGRVWILDGQTGQPLTGYPRASGGSLIIGQITSADVNGDGGQDAIVPTANGVHIFDGKNGTELYTLSYGGAGVRFLNSVYAGDLDSDSKVDLVMAGTLGDGITGVIRRYEFAPGDSAVLGSKGWPMNRKDARQTGSWSPPDLFDAPTGELGKGYIMAASDGGIFPFGEAKSFGSAGNLPLIKPMVCIASTPDGNGYWLVAADGGVFTYGNAGYYGSTGNVSLNKPIVGIERTATGNGYWLVASDGGIFPFGDAVGYGSTGNINLRQPIVGMARSATGNGYWLVASDGGIFPFGDAVGYGSTGNINLDKPIVSMSVSPLGGYTLFASDGGTFTFNAQNYGSLGRLPLNKPIIGAVQNGN